MFQLEQEILEAYNSIPEWAREDLCGKGACWQYSGNPVLGWNWVADSNLYKRLNFGKNLEIPSNPLAYLDVAHELIYDHNESIEIDFQKLDNHYHFIIKKPIDREFDIILGRGTTKLLACIDLYINVCSYYLETKMPSITELDCVDNFFTDTDGQMALDMTTSYAASVLFESYEHFVVDKYDVGFIDRDLETEHGIIKFVEGDVRVYSKYGVKEKPAPKENNTFSLTSGTISFGSGNNWQLDPTLSGVITISDGNGGVYTLEGKATPETLAKAVWKDIDIN